MELRQAVGSLMVVGLNGAELTGLERAWLSVVRPAGIILFRRNIENALQCRALLDAATTLAAPAALRCVDLEGGSVDRLRDALAPMPSAQAVARAMRKKNKPNLATEHGTLVARAVRSFGFNTTLAPVLDLGLNVSAQVMGSRTAGETPEEVAEYTGAFVAALTAAGVVGCGKHFPGLGGGTLDSHLATPSIERSFRTLWQQDLAPYRSLRNVLPMVMISHAAYPLTGGKSTPTSVSRYWIESVLRKRIGYKGLVFSDDLEMGGILNAMSMEEAAVESIRAGMDLIEICHSPELILRAFEALLHEGERSRAFRTLLLARATHTQRLRSKIIPKSKSKNAQQPEALAARIRAFAAKIEALQPAEDSAA
ncbi:beta-N-acetylhexosaminidase [Telmatobacter bradus]|uniref:beta-N-acetylhexosaminidase n=1 Tax=Telmatobacter bradus TaxID=474953 RepID=UPI003B43B46D